MKKLVPVLGAVVLLIAFSTLTLAQKAHRGLPFVGTRTFCDAFDVDWSKAPEGRPPKVIVSIRKDGFATVKTDIYGEGYSDTGTLFGKLYTFSGKLNAKWEVKRNSDTFLVVKSATTVSYLIGQDGFDMKMCETPPKKSNHAQRTPAVLPTVPVQTVEQGLMKISFSRLKSRDIARLYPALKGTVLTKREVSDDYDLPAFPPTALIADVRDKATNLNLVFLTSFWCGKQTGCAFQIYADEGRGYGLVGASSIKNDGLVFLLKDKGKTSVILCSDKEKGEWAYEGHNFKFKGPYIGKGVPVCK